MQTSKSVIGLKGERYGVQVILATNAQAFTTEAHSQLELLSAGDKCVLTGVQACCVQQITKTYVATGYSRQLPRGGQSLHSNFATHRQHPDGDQQHCQAACGKAACEEGSQAAFPQAV